jgi:hypothetical protein
MYYSETDVAAYNVLKDIINNEELWESTNTTQKVDLSVADTDEHYNYLKLIRKEYDEVIFSNLFKHYFTVNEKVFVSFCKEVLNGIELDDSYSIDRETEDNIDLLIQDDGNVIVIENKVKSGINGIKHDLYSDEIQSQLCKYYEYAQSIAADRKISCFIFAPDYKYFDLSGYKSGDYYKIVEYSKIYKFFNEHKEDFNSDKYFSDFLNALYKHSLKVDNELYDEMYRRFIQRINELSK